MREIRNFVIQRTDEQLLLPSYICSCVRQKFNNISLTRSLVQKLVMSAFQQGKFFVSAAVKENETRNCAIYIRDCPLILISGNCL